jgi:hypothetical protein
MEYLRAGQGGSDVKSKAHAGKNRRANVEAVLTMLRVVG